MVLEFPNSHNDWKLDAVGLLAVIGETTTETCVEPMTASYLCLLSRLIPAPQALIRPNRRLALSGVNATVTSINHGIVRTQLSYTANQLCPIANLSPFSVRVLSITYRNDASRNKSSVVRAKDIERGPPLPLSRRTTFKDVKAVIIRNYVYAQPVMVAKNISPHNILSVASCLLTIGLLVWAIIIGDGPATLAIILLAITTTLFCAASLWRLPQTTVSSSATVPDGDVIIQTREGAFLIIKCNEDVSRRLYFGTDDVFQLVTTGFSSCIGFGTVIFMVAVILMGNSTWTMQAALAATYLLLNAVYWFVAVMPSSTHWEFPAFQIDDITPPDFKNAHLYDETRNYAPSFINSLWLAILESKKVGWVRKSGALPEGDEWDRWLELAKRNALDNNRQWDAVKAREDITNASRLDAGETVDFTRSRL
ncbi:hypothetical protein V495_06807 [Pseudogymnoascus sp. VKM F-4514 (FW-929)]|nr:hypothetical protein V495_06807 [Pseudogymnoascus sp. VKM F-4514 (FW-929)]KFY66200.1 hypothetical protein V497_01042 [Pseudogymnoascus sp. VKM F-4516 (FW-969)]